MESQNFKESQAQIVNNLTVIDSLLNQNTVTPQKAQELHRIYTETITWIDENFANLDTDIIFQLLEFLNFYYEVV
jgi:hypothetical protein